MKILPIKVGNLPNHFSSDVYTLHNGDIFVLLTYSTPPKLTKPIVFGIFMYFSANLLFGILGFVIHFRQSPSLTLIPKELPLLSLLQGP
jgi:hypothetical protein